MPTTPRRARLWLKARRARVVRRDPFTIQLRFETTSYTQPATVGVDTGSQAVGLAALANGEVLVQAEVHLRTDISEKLAQRRTYRRARRSRKTRYRPAKWANRRRKAGWLPPSVSSKLHATLKAVRFVASFLPVRQVNVELASFDTQKMLDPEISGLRYQQGSLFGYQVREYLLTKWQRACAYCGAKEIALQVEHIVPKARGGSDRVDNLTLACEPCNQRKGNKTAAECGFPQIQAQARLPLRDAAHVSALKTALLTQLRQQFGEERVQVRYGYQTNYHRIQVLNLYKSHAHDAVAIACEEREVVLPLPVCWYLRCLPCGRYQRFNGKRSEHTCWAPHKVHGWKLYERIRAKGLTGYIAGRRKKGAFVVKDAISGKTLLEVTPRKLERVARPMHGWMITRQVADWSRKEGGASSPR
ncbi:MAG: RNA-guided endonuclease IscB [Ktedonobacteraceae bacterium]